jgi:uncharacterized protein YndB with AHSA1/START domain
MSPPQFHLVTRWEIAAPVETVWDELNTPQRWPEWWRAVLAVQQLDAADGNGLGAYWRMRWRTALPYSLEFNMRTVRVERHALLEGRADGELSGVGRWQFESLGQTTRVRYDWIVDVTQRWMRPLVPVARPIFAWNHDVVMAWGRQGLGSRIEQRHTHRLSQARP